MQTNRISTSWKLAFGASVLACLLVSGGWQASAQTADPVDVIRVDSDLVDLKVGVVTPNPQIASPALQVKDFLILENGDPQEISFFATADTPFDLVLLLDLSGSTERKINLIRRSAKRFVDATRPTDRVAIVTFTDAPRIASGLSGDRQQLKNSIDQIEKPFGGTNFWDALRFVLEGLLSSGQASHRSAVVVMTDGVDNALPDVYGAGSLTDFDELLTIVRRTDVLVFPVYVDTEPEDVKRHRTPRLAYTMARDQLEQLARACGTVMYRAGKLKDLDKVYERVITDLGTVYSIGYKPSNALRDGKWRSVSVRLPERQELIVRTRSGYYAKTETQSLKD